MLNQEFEGSTRALPVTYPASPLPGQMCRIGAGICGVAATKPDVNGLTVVEFSEDKSFDLSVTADSGPINVGDGLWFHDAIGINNTPSGGLFCGTAIDPIASGTATIRVKLRGTGSTYVSTILQQQAFAISAATTFFVGKAPGKGTAAAVSIVTDTVIPQSATAYWTISLIDKGAAGTGTTVIATVTTQTTSGVALAAFVEQALAIGSTPAIAANDILVLTLTPTGTPPAIGKLMAILKVQ
jgi:hypothetical protein